VPENPDLLGLAVRSDEQGRVVDLRQLEPGSQIRVRDLKLEMFDRPVR
jgi:hypothetical protein